MLAKIKFYLLRIGLILSAIGLVIIGVARFEDIAIGTPVLIVIGVLLFIVVIVRWKDLEKIGR